MALPSAVPQARPAPDPHVLTERFPLDAGETAPRSPAPPATSEPAAPSRQATPPAPAAEPSGDSSGGSMMVVVAIIAGVVLLAAGLVGGRALRRRWLRNSEPPIPPWRGSRRAPDGRAGVAAMEARFRPRTRDPGSDAVNARISPPEVPPVSQPDVTPTPPPPAPPAPAAPVAPAAAVAATHPGGEAAPPEPAPPAAEPPPATAAAPAPHPTSRWSRRSPEDRPGRASTTRTGARRCPTSSSSARPTAPAGAPRRFRGWGTTPSRAERPPSTSFRTSRWWSRRRPLRLHLPRHPSRVRDATRAATPWRRASVPTRPGSTPRPARCAAGCPRGRSPSGRRSSGRRASARRPSSRPPPPRPARPHRPRRPRGLRRRLRTRSLAAGRGARDRDPTSPTRGRGGPRGGHPRVPLRAQGPQGGAAGGGAGPGRIVWGGPHPGACTLRMSELMSAAGRRSRGWECRLRPGRGSGAARSGGPPVQPLGRDAP